MTLDRNRRHPDRASVGLVLLLLPSFLAGCHGRNHESVSPVPCQDLEFQAAISTLADGDVFFQEDSASCSSLDLGVMVNNLSGIWTVGFDVVYPSAAVRYESYTLGPLLQKGGPVNPPVVLVNTTVSGIQVTMSRLHPDPSVQAVGSEELIRFHFSRLASGDGVVDFDSSSGSTVSETILDDSGNLRPAIFGPGHGGLITVP